MGRELVLIPIEIYKDARYSALWHRLFLEATKNLGCPVSVCGHTEEMVLEDGQFLDTAKTVLYKARQVAEFAQGSCGKKVFFFYDLWHPGVMSLAYLRDNCHLDIKIAGVLHAGTWDTEDMLFQNGCSRWARGLEEAIVHAADRILVATEYHKGLIVRNLALDRETAARIHVVPFPIERPQLLATECPGSIAFPHRLAPEKDLARALRIVAIAKAATPEAHLVTTQGMTKAQYHRTLAESQVVLSTARQETFGIAVLEAAALGCIPVVPDALSYPETLAGWPRYGSDQEAAAMISQAIRNPGWFTGCPKVEYTESVGPMVDAVRPFLKG